MNKYVELSATVVSFLVVSVSGHAASQPLRGEMVLQGEVIESACAISKNYTEEWVYIDMRINNVDKIPSYVEITFSLSFRNCKLQKLNGYNVSDTQIAEMVFEVMDASNVNDVVTTITDLSQKQIALHTPVSADSIRMKNDTGFNVKTQWVDNSRHLSDRNALDAPSILLTLSYL